MSRENTVAPTSAPSSTGKAAAIVFTPVTAVSAQQSHPTPDTPEIRSSASVPKLLRVPIPPTIAAIAKLR